MSAGARGSDQKLEVHLSAQSFGGNHDCLSVVEVVENLLAGVPQGLEKHRNRKLPSAIDAHVEAIFGVEFKVDPGAPQRNNARRIEKLAARMGFSLVVIEEYARGPVKLGNDYPFGAIDYKRTVLSHYRNFAEIHFLLFDVANGAGTCVRVNIPNDELDRNLQGNSIGDAFLEAFFDVVFFFSQGVLDEFQRRRIGEILDGKNRPENSLQANVFAASSGGTSACKKSIVRLFLNLDQVRDPRDLGYSCKILPEPLRVHGKRTHFLPLVFGDL